MLNYIKRHNYSGNICNTAYCQSLAVMQKELTNETSTEMFKLWRIPIHRIRRSNIWRPGKEKRLPDVLSKKDIFVIIKSTNIIKHQCVLAMIYIQTLLGHNSSKTTEQYTHVSKKSLRNITSPMDVIFNNKELINKQLKK